MNLLGTTGQERRRWLDERGDGLYNTLQRYLGPTGIPNRLAALARAAEYTDAGDMVEAADASRALWNDPSIANAGRYATAGAALAIPYVGAKMMNDGVDVVGDALRSGSDDLSRFATEQDGTFAGIRAKTADLNALARAEDMTASGASRDDIWRDTGWFQGVDGKWRFEIDDSARRVDIPSAAKARDDAAFSLAEEYEDAARIRSRAENRGMTLKEAADSIAADTGKPVSRNAWVFANAEGLYSTNVLKERAASAYPTDVYAEPFRLREVMQHDDLFAAYPMTQNRPLQVGGQNMASFKAAYRPSEDDFFLQKYLDRDPDYSVGHEIQHRIQEQEGFARGGNQRTTIAELLQPVEKEMDDLAASGAWDGWNVWYNSPDTRKMNLSYRQAVAKYIEDNPSDEGFARIAKLQRDKDDLLLQGGMEYNDLAGEVESRNVQTRRDFTPDQRRAAPPWETQDVPDERQIVRMGGR